MGLNRAKILREPLPPRPPEEGFRLVLDAIHKSENMDDFRAELFILLENHGFKAEATKLLRYSSLFCPCDYHFPTVPRGTSKEVDHESS